MAVQCFASVNARSNQLIVMYTTRGETGLISIWCQMECMESTLDGQTDSHCDYSAHLWVMQNFETKSLKYCGY